MVMVLILLLLLVRVALHLEPLCHQALLLASHLQELLVFLATGTGEIIQLVLLEVLVVLVVMVMEMATRMQLLALPIAHLM